MENCAYLRKNPGYAPGVFLCLLEFISQFREVRVFNVLTSGVFLCLLEFISQFREVRVFNVLRTLKTRTSRNCEMNSKRHKNTPEVSHFDSFY